jgi:hypothetical protein
MYYHDRRRIIARHVDSLFHSLRKTAIVLKVSHTTIVKHLLAAMVQKLEVTLLLWVNLL